MSNIFSRSGLGYEDPGITAGANDCIDTAPHRVVQENELRNPSVNSKSLEEIFFDFGMQLGMIMLAEGVGRGSTTRASILETKGRLSGGRNQAI